MTTPSEDRRDDGPPDCDVTYYARKPYMSAEPTAADRLAEIKRLLDRALGKQDDATFFKAEGNRHEQMLRAEVGRDELKAEILAAIRSLREERDALTEQLKGLERQFAENVVEHNRMRSASNLGVDLVIRLNRELETERAARAEAERARDEDRRLLEADAYDADKKLLAALQRAATAERTITELSQDAERLDWMQVTWPNVNYDFDDEDETVSIHLDHRRSGRVLGRSEKGIREAIDAARASVSPETTEEPT